MKNVGLVLGTILMVTSVFAQDNKIPLIGSKAPEFSANSTNGKLTFPNDFGKGWKVLFSHPADFTPVCSTELLELANLQPQFDKLGVKIAVISTDDVDMHKSWVAYLQELNYKDRGHQTIKFPLFEDVKGTSSRKYGMIQEAESSKRTIRGVYIIDSNNIVRSVNFYPMQVGRNMDEIVRIVEALQTSDEAHVLTPADWRKGDDVMIPNYPYTPKELADNPSLKDDYYMLGNRIWFKKAEK